ncbi:type 1 fimbrial protein [Enterobacter bugandensis]|uniref:Type 1 fimbrial protein n=1 Tax=Enterobacter bugandensis TaxID=881260 RepID=A0AA42TM36_9ENTR|nr:fimbrial protein [Enterobacter bugandensis]MDH1321541.1 type 1 fimbrial protein [Enterobacter bugandensis]
MRRSICIILLCLLLLPATTWSAGELVGHVRMQGSIIETPCAIALNSIDQSIDMSVLPIEKIMRDGGGPTRPFKIRMVGCNFAPVRAHQQERSAFYITFDGTATNNGLFAVHGQGRGVGLQIANEDGYMAAPGQPIPVGKLLPGNDVLNYTLRLVANRSPLRAGPYRATIRLKLDYY